MLEMSTGSHRRLVMLVPEGELDEGKLAGALRGLAAPHGLRVLFLARRLNAETEAEQTRRLASLATLTTERTVKTSVHQAAHKDWIKALQEVQQPGDLVVVYPQQPAPGWALRRTSLAAYLGERFGAPVHTLSGLRLESRETISGRTRSLISWSASVAALIFFTWLEMSVGQAIPGGTASIIMIFLILLELGVIYKINDLIG